MKKILTFLIILCSFLTMSACDLQNSEQVKNVEIKPTLLIDGKEVSTENAFFVDKNITFLALDVLAEHYKNPDIEYNSCGIKTKLNLSNFCDYASIKDVFYNEKITFIIPSVTYNDKKYVNIRFLREILNIKVIELGNVLAVFTSDQPTITPNSKAFLPKNTQLYYKSTITYEDLQKTGRSYEVYVVNHPDFSAASMPNNEAKLACYIEDIGLCYVDIDDLEQVSLYNNQAKKIKVAYKKDKYKALQMDWDSLDNYQAALVNVPSEKIKGLDILIPTCFTFGEDSVKSSLAQEYVEAAKDLGYLVYGYFTNGKDAEFLRNILSNSQKRQEMIDSLLFYAAYFELDGLNFDFVNLNRLDRDSFVSFFPELAEKAHSLGITVSLCVPPSLDDTPLSEGYIDFTKLQTSVDFFVLMAVDQYNSGLKEPCPVSTIKWVKKNLDEIVEVVPNDKIILAQANYLRLFTLDEGAEKVKDTRIISNSELDKLTENRAVNHFLANKYAQEGIEFTDLDKPLLYRVWLETESSLAKRIELVNDYDLRGYATWNLGFEEAWQQDLKNKILNK